MRRAIEYVVKGLIRLTVRLVPGVVRVEAFKELSRVLDVESVTVRGRSGLIEGSAVDFVMGTYMKQKTWSPELIELITKDLFPATGGTYLDIGANIGLTTIPIANSGQITCHCFEPEPDNFKFLKRNIEINAADRDIHLHNCALYSRNGSLDLEISPDNKGDHRLRHDDPKVEESLGERTRALTRVEARTLDSLLSAETLRRPVIAKLDTQGAETEILRGGTRVFSRIDGVIAEFWPYGLLRMGCDVEEFFDLMRIFPFGRILRPGQSRAPDLRPVASLIEQLKGDEDLLAGKAGNSHLDVLLTRQPGLPLGEAVRVGDPAAAYPLFTQSA